MKKAILILSLLSSGWAAAVVYDDFEIRQQLLYPKTTQASADFISQYFTSKNPNQVVNDLLKADLDPLEREYLLHSLLTEISTQPPQAFFQKFVDQMKDYQIEATRAPDEGHSPVAIFNIRSKAHGIENIWVAYKTEQRFSQLFNKSIADGIAASKILIASGSRPGWLGLKNSITALPTNKKQQLAQHLIRNTKNETEIDRLYSFVGLLLGNHQLLQKALASEQQSIREYTLRKLPDHISHDAAKSIILTAAQDSNDMKFSTALLAQFGSDQQVQSFLLEKVSDKDLAENAAFALSQINDRKLHEQMQQQYLKTDNLFAKNHILLALKLSQSASAKVILQDIKSHMTKDSVASKWLKSFAGERP